MNLWIIAIFFVLQFGMGIYLSKKISNDADYLVGGKQVPMWLITFSLFATWFGAETCIGTSGEVYEHGLAGSRADPFGYGLSLFFIAIFLAKKLWFKNYITLSDFYLDRYGSLVEKISVWVLLPSSLFWAAAQLRAFGQIIAATTDLPVETTLLIAFSVVVSYTLLGGLLGDIFTDLLQGIIITVGLFLITYFVLVSDESIELELVYSRLNFNLPGESWLARIDRWVIPITGSFVAQEVISKILSAKSGNEARKASFFSSGIYLLIGGIPVVLGLVGPQILSGVSEKEQFLILLAKKFLPPFGFSIFVASLFAAILATVDSILLACTALLSRNFLIPVFKVTEDKKKLLVIRIGVIISALISLFLAKISESIYELIEASASIGMAGIFVITILGLWTKIGGKFAALAALIIGVVAMPINEYMFQLQAPFLFSLLFSGLAFVSFSFVDSRNLK